MRIEYPEIGICGLSCRLCADHLLEDDNKCDGCKSEYRIRSGGPFITCALEKGGIEFCWQCPENETCNEWQQFRSSCKKDDADACHQKLEDNLSFIMQKGIDAFEQDQRMRQKLLHEMLNGYDDGQSSGYYFSVANLLEIDELEAALTVAWRDADGLEVDEKTGLLRSILDGIADRNALSSGGFIEAECCSL